MRRIFYPFVFVLSIMRCLNLNAQNEFGNKDIPYIDFREDISLMTTENQSNSSNVTLTCPEDKLVELCMNQLEIDNIYDDWIKSASFTTTCMSTLSNNSSGNPNKCNDTKIITWTLVSDCAATLTCSSSFTIKVPEIILKCPQGQNVADLNVPNIQTLYSDWKALMTSTGGCNVIISNDGDRPLVSGCNDVTFTISSECEAPRKCTSSFMVGTTPHVVLVCPNNQIEAACQTQSTIDSKYKSWIESVQVSGGCATRLLDNHPQAPSHCGGNTSNIFVVKSESEADVSCKSSFTVINAIPISVTCPRSITESACQTQASIDSKFASWKLTVLTSGGCSASVINPIGSAPDKCGGTTTLTFEAQDLCSQTATCSSTFTVASPPIISITCPRNVTESACQTQASIDSKFAIWKATVSASGGCDLSLITPTASAPSSCGGTSTVTFVAEDLCKQSTNCTATFTVTIAPPIILNCPVNVTEEACQEQSVINQKFEDWLNSTSFSGACNGVLSNNAGVAPDKCGGTTTVTFTTISDCEAPVSCAATFTVDNPTTLALTCPANVTIPACQTQAKINENYNAWLNSVSATGGCKPKISFTISNPPNSCGGIATVAFTAKDDCNQLTNCNATFTVEAAPALILTCPENRTEAPCQTQSEIDTKFNNWKNSANFVGGCNGIMTNSGGSAPDKCGGVTTVTFTASSDCEPNKICNSTFVVTNAPKVELTCPEDLSFGSDIVDVVKNKYIEWLNQVIVKGGCNTNLVNDAPSFPKFGTNEIKFTINSDCADPVTCQAKFIVTAVAVNDVNSSDLYISIQPNPINNLLQVLIKGNFRGQFDFIINDLSGKQVFQSTEIKNKEELLIKKDASQLILGSYILTLVNKKGHVSEKFVVLR